MNGFTAVALEQSMRVQGVLPGWQIFVFELYTNPTGHSYSVDSSSSQTRDLLQSPGSEIKNVDLTLLERANGVNVSFTRKNAIAGTWKFGSIRTGWIRDWGTGVSNTILIRRGTRKSCYGFGILTHTDLREESVMSRTRNWRIQKFTIIVEQSSAQKVPPPLVHSNSASPLMVEISLPRSFRSMEATLIEFYWMHWMVFKIVSMKNLQSKVPIQRPPRIMRLKVPFRILLMPPFWLLNHRSAYLIHYVCSKHIFLFLFIPFFQWSFHIKKPSWWH